MQSGVNGWAVDAVDEPGLARRLDDLAAPPVMLLHAAPPAPALSDPAGNGLSAC